MRTPDGTLERNQPLPLSDPVVINVSNEESTVSNIMSWPMGEQQNNSLEKNSEYCDDGYNKNTLEEDSTAINIPPDVEDSSPDMPQPMYDPKQGWMTGIFGCLKPVLSIIGKGVVVETRHNPDDWEIPFEKITDLQFISSGAQGAVFSGFLNNTPIAVKKVPELKDTDILNLRKLNHPNIIKFKGICTQEPCFCIVMEFCPYGSLFNLLKTQKNVMTLHRVVSWAKQIASGMHYLHLHKIIHRDLKSPNVLIGEEEIIKISDFGTSRTWNGVSEKMTFAGTVAWMAPEAIRGLACSEKVDIWSFGVVLWELLTCEVPYDGMEQGSILYSVGSGKLRPPIPSTCPEGFKLIMEMCWKHNPKVRPSFKLIFNHLEIAAVEILGKFHDDQFFKTQESWKQEIKSQITQFVEGMQKHKFEYQMKEEQLIKRREMEIKHILDIKELFDRKMKQVDELCAELNGMMQRERAKTSGLLPLERKDRRKKFLNWRKMDRRRPSCHNSTTPTSPECVTSPDTPNNSPKKVPAIVGIASGNEMATTHVLPSRRRHNRSISTSPRSSGISRSSSCRASVVVDAETQTHCGNSCENDLNSPMSSLPAELCTGLPTVYPQRVILQEFRCGSSDDELSNGNKKIQFHFMAQHATKGDQNFKETNSKMYNPNEDSINRNLDNNDTENNVISTQTFENGNITNSLRYIRRCSLETREEMNSTEDGHEDSLTDDDNCTYYQGSLRRKSVARRPIYPGRKLKKNSALNHSNQRQNIDNFNSDEENTSEYTPSSKSSTLESNPVERIGNTQNRTNEDLETSESESEDDNNTIVTQLAFTVNEIKY